ncbi:Gfo/Idh/MocA family oxidoreductase [Gilvimarinus agarilyticus]|uniref:Gfo/Idh/MocA family protein n=1 Tax=Gilvimarinus sp. 2_MG-2023 TaxID=3062666 RepID=UPI001C084FEE|nr:Gfo/Idh/MocA family oxidoreductase [Gilvimarinus sp. 2_MG-2023]MBU2886872.1 Gfo/Idh/MocA family oxidoreductase [Gilvimarinus agarilyticus]MDO6571533.1 Gfo/Idh/MocA family oxidoreductase [Gilvimarinus sp. 2_MG-2023]
MRLALVGLGDIAQKAYLPAVIQHLPVTPVLCTRNHSTLHQLAERYRISECYTDFAELLRSRPDAVMIHSSTESHYALAQAALAAGIPTFVDKPLSYRLEEAEHLIALAQAEDTPLFCGFNRRYAPLYQKALAVPSVSIVYQKHRHNLADEARHYVYDDFIHVLDFVRFCSAKSVQNIQVHACHRAGRLANVTVAWQHSGTSCIASMNRISGQTRERLECSGDNISWQVDNLSQGLQMENNQASPIGFGDWQETLYKRGFYTMLEAFMQQVKSGRADREYLQGVLHTHRLCEEVLQQIRPE